MEMNTAVKIPGVLGNLRSKGSAAFSKISLFFFDKPYFTALLTAFLLFFPILYFFKIYFQLNDDYWAFFLLKGIVLSRHQNDFNLLNNVCFCLFLKKLYMRFPNIQWYPYLFVLTHFLALWGILSSIQLGTQRLLKTIIFVISVMAVEIHFVDCLQWTVVASMAAVSAFLLLASVWRRGDSKYLGLGLFLLFILIMFSVLIRFDAFLLMGLLSLPFAIYISWKIKMTTARWVVIGFLVITAVLSLGVVRFNHDYLLRVPVWEEAVQFGEQLRETREYRDPVYNKTTKPVFDSIGWSENDLILFKSWYSMDEEKFSIEKMKKLNDYFSRLPLNENQWGAIGEVFRNVRTQLLLLIFFALLPFFLEKDMFFHLGNGLWTFLIIALCALYLKVPERIYLPSFLLMNVTGVFLTMPESSHSGEKSKVKTQHFIIGSVYLCVILLLSLYIFHLDYKQNENWTHKANEFKASFEKFGPKEDQLFVTWGSAFPYELIPAFDDDTFLKSFHVIELAALDRTPAAQEMSPLLNPTMVPRNVGLVWL